MTAESINELLRGNEEALFPCGRITGNIEVL